MATEVGPDKAAARVPFRFDGRALEGQSGDTLLSALWRLGVLATGRRRDGGGARGPWCVQGHCGACSVVVDGVHGVRACLLPLRPGLEAASEPPAGAPAVAGGGGPR